VPHAAICLLSALRFHDLTSQNPHEVWIAIGPKDRKPTLEYPSIKVVRYGDERFEIGLENHQLEGTLVRVYSVARTVVDLFTQRGLEIAQIHACRNQPDRGTLPDACGDETLSGIHSAVDARRAADRCH